MATAKKKNWVANPRMTRWLAHNRQEYLTEFQVVAGIGAIGSGRIAD